mgnify:CR=1 FL=1
MKKMLFIMNPYSGKRRANKYLVEILEVFNRANYQVTVHMTAGRGDATEVAKTLGTQMDIVVCCGGDGTFNETVAGLLKAGANVPVGYIPAGSTNDFAASLHLPTEPLEAAKEIVEGEPIAYDAGSFCGRFFSYVASFGAFTRSSYSASQAAKNALGHFAYILEGLGDLDSLRPYNCCIEADGEVFEGDFIFGAVCNCTSMGGLVKLDPNRVKMDDGRFELLLLRMPKSALDLQNLITAMTRMQYDYPGVIFRHVQRVTLTTQAHIPWSLDGEYAPSAARVDIENLPGAVSLLR